MEDRKSFTLDEHIKTAYAFLEHSERELSSGDKLQASEKLWGAAAHAMTAIMLKQGTRGRSHRDLKVAAKRLSTDLQDPHIYAGFLAAEKFHVNFYTGIMEDYEIELDKDQVHDFVNRILSNNSANAGSIETAP